VETKRILREESNMNFFSADHHFDHRGVVGRCRRPFGTVLGMNACFITWWNTAVSQKDTVYYVGDFAWRSSKARLKELVSALNGHIILIPGNHDCVRKMRGVGLDIREPLITLRGVEEHDLILCHYPLSSWPKMRYGTWMLHGHSHGNPPPEPFANRMDVGVDNWRPKYRPVTFKQIKERMLHTETRRLGDGERSGVCRSSRGMSTGTGSRRYGCGQT